MNISNVLHCLRIIGFFKPLIKNRTTFIITHRLATIKNADLIIVLKDGSLLDSGTHEELILRNIDYRRLFERFSELPPMIAMEGD